MGHMIPNQPYNQPYHYMLDNTVGKLHNHSEEHDHMTLPALAEHLGVDLWKAMEIGRWAFARAKTEGV